MSVKLRRNPDERHHYEVGRIGRDVSLSDRRSRGFASCMRCGTAWCFVPGHSTRYDGTKGKGCFPLCDECWAELTPNERMPFYRVLWEQWRMSDVLRGRNTDEIDAEWPLIEAADPAESNSSQAGDASSTTKSEPPRGEAQ